MLSGNIAAERPGRFRLTAGTALTGQEIDLGSNDELFWMWVRRNQPPAVYFCRHDQFANSNIRQMMPIEPTLAAGRAGHGRPRPGHWSSTARCRAATARSSYAPGCRHRLAGSTRDRDRRSPRLGRRAAHLRPELARRYWPARSPNRTATIPSSKCRCPERLSIRLPTSGIDLKIDLGAMQINQLNGDRQQLWTLPAFEGYPQYDLGGAVPGTPVPGRLTAPPPPDGVTPAGYPAYPTTGYPASSAEYLSAPQASNGRFMPLPRYGLPRYAPPPAAATANQSPSGSPPANSYLIR